MNKQQAYEHTEQQKRPRAIRRDGRERHDDDHDLVPDRDRERLGDDLPPERDGRRMRVSLGIYLSSCRIHYI